MGNSHLQSSYSYQTVDEIPEGMAPPSVNAIQMKAKEYASKIISKLDPTNLETCRECIKLVRPDKTRIHKIMNELSSYLPEDPPYMEKTVKFRNGNFTEVWVSSTKNSDHTLSYWIQYPIQPLHISAAILQLMNIPITSENLHDITQKYPILYKQLLYSNQNEIIKCEQIDPLYLDIITQGLISKGFNVVS
jgi:hypothetical protein